MCIMTMKKSVIALVICLAMLLSACQANISLPTVEATPTEATPTQITPTEITPSEAAPSEASPTQAPVEPLPVDETTYRELEKPLAAILAVDSGYLFTPGEDAKNAYGSVTPQYAAAFLYQLSSGAYKESAKPDPSLNMPGYTSFVSFSAEQLKDVFDLVFYGRLTVDDFLAASAGLDGIAVKDGVCYVGIGELKAEAGVEYLRVNDDGTIDYSFNIDDASVKTEGVLTAQLTATTDTKWGTQLSSYAVVAAGTETPAAEFVTTMRALLDSLKIEYELLGPDGSPYNSLTGNPTFANMDYFWLDTSTRTHSDKCEIESVSLKFNEPKVKDDKSKAILLACIKALSRYATIEELEAALPELEADGQTFVGSCIVQFNGEKYWLNLPDSEE